MEIANLWRGLAEGVAGVRVARVDDAAAITELMRRADYFHQHVDWRSPSDWLGSPSFVVYPELGSTGADQPVRLAACLAATADPPPAAWVRVASVAAPTTAGETISVGSRLAAMLLRLLESLLAQGVSELAWLPVDKWPNRWLPSLGFKPVNEIETYLWRGREVPKVSVSNGLEIRPAANNQMEDLARLEEEAFAPLWRHSAEGLTLAQRQAVLFDVAWLDGRLAGFQFCTASGGGAHLARMTVGLQHQRAGVGSALLASALSSLRRLGVQQVTLNTQVDNVASKRLYEKFGFEATGQRLPVWAVQLA